MRALISLTCCALTGVMVCATTVEGVHGIPKGKLKSASIYWGKPSAFTKVATVKYDVLIKSTPEYQEIKKKKLKSSDAASWILMSDATDRVRGAIAGVAKGKKYDLVCAKAYWDSLKLNVRSSDITKTVQRKVARVKK